MPPRLNPDPIGRPRLQPESPGAYPVDPYNRPAPSRLERLAAALGDLAPSLQRIGAKAQEDEGKAGEKKAYADFLEMEKAGQKIKAGELNPEGSVFFRRFYHETIGRLAASQFNSDRTAAVADPSSGLAQSTDPADFDAFTASFRESWVKDHVGNPNADFLAGFNRASAGYDINARNDFAASAGARLQGKAIEALYAEHQVTIRDLLKSGGGAVQIADALKLRNQQQYFLNPRSGKQISETTIQAVFDAARAYQDPGLLDILDHIDSAVPGASLGQTQSVLSKIADVRNQIMSDIKKDDAFAETQTKKRKQDAIFTTLDGLYEALDSADDPQAVDVKPFADSLTGIAPDQKERLYRVKDAYIRRDQQETAAQAGPLFERAFRGTLTLEEVADAFSVGQIGKDTAKELRAQVRLNRTGKGAKTIVEEPLYKSKASDLEGLYRNQMGQFFSPVTAAQATVAKWQLERDWVKFRLGAGREASTEEASIWLQQRAAELFAQNSGTPVGADPQKQAAQILTDFAAPRGQAALTDWNKTRLVSANFLTRIITEQANSRTQKRNALSPAVQSFLRGYRLNTPDDVDAFIKAQSSLPEIQ